MLELTFPIEEFVRILPGKRYRLRNLAQKLNDLRNVIVVLAISRSRGGVEEVVAACDEFEEL